MSNDFGSVPLNSSSQAATITLVNSGNAGATVNLVVGGLNAIDFGVQPGGLSVGANASSTFAGTFSPTSFGSEEQAMVSVDPTTTVLCQPLPTPEKPSRASGPTATSGSAPGVSTSWNTSALWDDGVSRRR